MMAWAVPWSALAARMASRKLPAFGSLLSAKVVGVYTVRSARASRVSTPGRKDAARLPARPGRRAGGFDLHGFRKNDIMDLPPGSEAHRLRWAGPFVLHTPPSERGG